MADLPSARSTEDLRKTEIIVREPNLGPDIKGWELAVLIENKLREADSFYNGILKLDKRRKKNTDYWMGNQVDESVLNDWQQSYVDNIIFRDLEFRVGVAASKSPDITTISPKNDPVSRERARKVDRSLEIRILNEGNQRLIKDGLRDNHLLFVAIIKPVWDSTIGDDGDFVFRKLDPRQVVADHTATIPHDGYSADNMEMICEWVEEPVAVICRKFPDKAEEFKKRVAIVQGTMNQMASKVRYQEVWYTYYDDEGAPQEAVCWKYGKLILANRKIEETPYWDAEGIQVPQADGKMKEVMQNFFEFPRKPYIFINYTNNGDSPIDNTTVVEQSLNLQKNINIRGRQITEISNNAVPKKVFDQAAMSKDQAAQVDNDPNQHIILDLKGQESPDINKAFGTVHADPPSPILYEDMQSNRAEIHAMFGTKSAMFNQQDGGAKQSAASKQMDREADMSVTDDLVNTTVVRVITEQCGWTLQMIKVNYNHDHQMSAVGKDGDLANLTLNQTSVDDGIGIQVKASTTDKVRRRAEAMELAKDKLNDPMSMFEDLDVPNPKERTERWIALNKAKDDQFASYEKVVGIDSSPGAAASSASQASGLDRDQAIEDIQNIKENKPVDSTGLPTQAYVQAFQEFANSGLADLPKDAQKRFEEFIVQLKQRVADMNKPAPQKGQPPKPGGAMPPPGQPPAGGPPPPAPAAPPPSPTPSQNPPLAQ